MPKIELVVLLLSAGRFTLILPASLYKLYRLSLYISLSLFIESCAAVCVSTGRCQANTIFFFKTYLAHRMNGQQWTLERDRMCVCVREIEIGNPLWCWNLHICGANRRIPFFADKNARPIYKIFITLLDPIFEGAFFDFGAPCCIHV